MNITFLYIALIGTNGGQITFHGGHLEFVGAIWPEICDLAWTEKNEGKCAKRHFANSRQLRACAKMRAKYRT